MQTHVDKTQENKRQSAANRFTHKQESSLSAFQFVDNRPEATAQRKLQETADNSPQATQATQLQSMADNYSVQKSRPIQKKSNNTGLPDSLKSGIESLSDHSMDDVKVHYNSDRPAQLNAHAYAQGTNIHLGPGQEKHLPHEAWHVVQQKQGRVEPTARLKGNVNINDDKGLEQEADVMGAKAVQKQAIEKPNGLPKVSLKPTIQRASFFAGDKRFKTQDCTYDELSSMLSRFKKNHDEISIKSLREACVKEIKNLTKGSRVSQEELGELLNSIDGVQEKKPEKRISTADTSKALSSHKYKELSERIKILKNQKIDHWIHADKPLPESNVKGEIAEELTQYILVNSDKNAKRTVLSSVKIVVDNGVDAQYRYTEKADLDHLVVISTEGGLMPVEIIETKAGAEGGAAGNLTTILSKKLKELMKVKEKGYRIMSKESDITDKFNLSKLGSAKVELLTSGIFPDNDIQLKESEIAGIFDYLQIVQKHNIAYRNEW